MMITQHSLLWSLVLFSFTYKEREMAVTIYYASVLERELTIDEWEANFTNIVNAMIEASVLGNNSILIKDNGGNIQSVEIPEATLLGRETGGNIAALNKAAILTLLELDTSDIDGLATALGNKADTSALDAVNGDVGVAKVVAQGTEVLTSGSASATYAGFNTATDEISLNYKTTDGNIGILSPSGQTDGGGFTINSNNPSDGNTVFWQVWRANS